MHQLNIPPGFYLFDHEAISPFYLQDRWRNSSTLLPLKPLRHYDFFTSIDFHVIFNKKYNIELTKINLSNAKAILLKNSKSEEIQVKRTPSRTITWGWGNLRLEIRVSGIYFRRVPCDRVYLISQERRDPLEFGSHNETEEIFDTCVRDHISFVKLFMHFRKSYPPPYGPYFLTSLRQITKFSLQRYQENLG